MQSSTDKAIGHSLLSAVDKLMGQLELALATPLPKSAKLLRVSTMVNDISPLLWLRAQQGVSRYYWKDRDNGFTMAGIGEANVLEPTETSDYATLFECMHQSLDAQQPALRYYGGFRFQNGRRKGDRWHKFKAYRFIVPRIELCQIGEKFTLSLNALLEPDTDIETLREKCIAALGSLCDDLDMDAVHIPHVHDRIDLPDKATWRSIVLHALDDIAAGKMEKVVLARETSFLAGTNFDPVDVLSRLNEETFGTFVFCFQPAPFRAFLGASPERLYKRHNAYLQSEAVAGTRPRSADPQSDSLLADALLSSDKDQREHQFVVKMLEEHLTPFCSNIQYDHTPRIMSQRHCQHLHTPFQAVLKNDESDAALLQSLHPTPAVGGLPRAAALAWLDENEPFDRGIYAAPVGWVGYDSAEFAVAIRSAIVRENTLALYAGAGIVTGSDPDEEWAEINQKMQGMLGILTEDKST